jgi:DNA repair protein SbcD/Mre11
LRIVHLADTHLGFRQLHRVNDAGRNVREQDVYDAFADAIEITVGLDPDAVIHAGDLFDSYHPSSAALGAALDGFARLREAGIPIVVIAGNHSTPRVAAADHVFGVLDRFGGVHVVHGASQVVRIEGRGRPGVLAVHAIPHDNDPAAVSAALRDARPADADFNVLVAHVGLDGLGQLVGSEAGSLTLSGEALAEAGEFDYVALGHLHKFAPARDNGAYAGSLERLSWGDDADFKGVVEVNLAAGRRSPDYLRLHPVPTRAMIELDAVDAASCEDLTAAIIARGEGEGLAGAMVRITVRNVTAADWNAIDARAVGAAYAECLHFERAPQLIGAPAGLSATAPALREFLAAWPGLKTAGIELDEFVARAEGFLALADQELAG